MGRGNLETTFLRSSSIILYTIYKFQQQNVKPFIAQIQSQLKITYSALFDLITQIEKAGWIKTTKVRLKKYVELTPKGREVAEAIRKIVTVEKEGASFDR